MGQLEGDGETEEEAGESDHGKHVAILLEYVQQFSAMFNNLPLNRQVICWNSQIESPLDAAYSRKTDLR